MYKLSIPVMLSKQFRPEETLEELKRAKCSRVFLAIDQVPFSKSEREAELNDLRANIEYFKNAGLEVGVWYWSFMRQDPENDTRSCELRVLRDGSRSKKAYCPLSHGFLEDTVEFIEETAKLSPDIILFDDDYGMAFSDGPGRCYCQNHLNLISEILGESIDRETLFKKAFQGKSNKYRKALLQASSEGLDRFSKAIRQAVDRINPDIRIGICTNMSAWDMDGSDAIHTERLLAGGTKPLIRTIMAPYWPVVRAWNHRLQHTVEHTRLQATWLKNEDIETMCEGDVYPRPRYKVPSNYLEGYDTALRFAGATNGILKYMLDYNAPPRYETGYIDRHVRNFELYERIAEITEGKQACGVRIYNYQRKYAEADLTGISDPYNYGLSLFFPRASKLLSDNSVPTTYEGDGCCGIVFGENARYLPESALENGLILDIRAAKILTERGVDVGIKSVGEAVVPKKYSDDCTSAQCLYYPDYDQYTATGYDGNCFYEFEPSEGARAVTVLKIGNHQIPETIFYENKKGQRFMVFGFDAYFTTENRYRSYCVQRQLFDAIEWFGKKAPVKIIGNPDLYVQCKRDDNSMTVGLWNFFDDDVFEPTVELDRDYAEIECVNCTGILNGNKVVLSDIKPYGNVFFMVK